MELESALEREARKIGGPAAGTGFVIGVYRQGRTWQRGGGVLAPGADAPDGGTVFQIGSLSKLFTAGLLQALCDAGVVQVDSTLEALIGHRWPLSPSARAVTLRQLATHTAGFPSVPAALEAEAVSRAGDRPWDADPYSHLGRESIFRYLATTPDQARPGRFRYSNFGMGLLAHVLEEVTGRELEPLVVQVLLDPLGMDSTRLEPTPAMQARLAPGHDARGRPAGLWRFASLAGAGGWLSSVNDLLRFVGASLGPDGPAAAAFEAMRRPQGRGETGLGWMQAGRLERCLGLQGMVWHNGRVGGYAAYLSIDPVAGGGTVLLANRSADVTLPGLMLGRQVRRRSWSATAVQAGLSGAAPPAGTASPPPRAPPPGR